MKTSLVALTAAFALTLGATSVSVAQDAPATQEECLAEQGAGVPAPNEALTTETGDDEESSDGPRAEGLEPSLGQEIDCHDVVDSDD